jgi:hypothetical protein
MYILSVALHFVTYKSCRLYRIHFDGIRYHKMPVRHITHTLLLLPHYLFLIYIEPIAVILFENLLSVIWSIDLFV